MASATDHADNGVGSRRRRTRLGWVGTGRRSTSNATQPARADNRGRSNGGSGDSDRGDERKAKGKEPGSKGTVGGRATPIDQMARHVQTEETGSEGKGAKSGGGRSIPFVQTLHDSKKLATYSEVPREHEGRVVQVPIYGAQRTRGIFPMGTAVRRGKERR